jgi:DNA-binding GntR family transcriptional regulator
VAPSKTSKLVGKENPSGIMSSPNVASHRIADQLRAKILDDTWLPGERIRQEELAEEYEASRIPVREALRILETDGLVTVVSNQGAWVASLTREECLEQYEIRERLEPLLLRESLPKLSPTQLARLEELANQMQANRDVSTFMQLDREFHMLSYAAAPDTTLKQIIQRLWNTTQHYRRAYANMAGSPGLDVTHLEHKLLVEAITRRDSEDAERIIAGHIRRTRLLLAQHPEVFQTPSN